MEEQQYFTSRLVKNGGGQGHGEYIGITYKGSNFIFY